VTLTGAAAEIIEAPAAPLAAIGIVVPVRNEEARLGSSLRSLALALRIPELRDVAVSVAVVLDACVDGSAEIARRVAGEVESHERRHRVRIVDATAGNVGIARGIGFSEIMADLEDVETRQVWLATTDADSRVPECWLSCQTAQRALGIDAWAGTVAVADWAGRSTSLPSSFRRHYRVTPPEGGHIHGASMGFSAVAYREAGGFPPLATGEDHALWRRLGAVGARRIHDASCPVATSARREARAPSGFAGALDRLEYPYFDLEGTDAG
jgi:hypothetical protein